MRKLDRDQLQLWIATNGVLAKENLSALSGIGFYTLRRILQNRREPKMCEQLALCHATGLKLDELFPVVENKKESQAS